MKKVMYKDIDKNSLRYAEKNSIKKVTLMDYFLDTMFQEVNVEEGKALPKKSIVFDFEEDKKLKKVSSL